MERTITGTVGEVKGRTVNTKYGEKTVFDITIGSQKTSTFKSDIAEEANALKGSDVEATVRVEPREGYPDNYMLLGVKLVDAYPAAAVPVTSAIATSTIPAGSTISIAPAAEYQRPKHPDEAANINRQSALGTAFHYGAAAGLDIEETFALAKRIYDTAMGVPAQPQPETVAVGAAAPTETTEDIPW